ncbi:MAG: hypothetical protein QOH06_746 [Acidobacteriota bacterium]|nr:hypothetical protein [Acidobacteriota bacterium]
MKRIIAATELLLISPAALFMTALFVRKLGPLQDEPARTAHEVAMWYAGRQWTLWALLIVLPLIAVVTGCATLLRNWNDEVESRHAPGGLLASSHADLATLFIAAMTLTAGGMLARVAVHMLAN